MSNSASHHPVLRSLFVTGLFQIIGGMTFFFSGLLLVIMRFDEPYRNRFENPVCGVWSGMFLILVGAIGVLASGRPGPMRVVYMVMSCLLIPPVLVTTVISAAGAADNIHYYVEHPGYNKGSFEQNEMSLAKMAFHILICFVGAIELTIVLLVGVFSCNSFCPGTTMKQQTTQQNNNTPPPVTYDPAPSYAYPPPAVTNPDLSGNPAEAEAKV